ncbi:pyruvate phosphate dikinase [Magnetococcus marinus MC-1]|uniref:Pyruvate, phosphate dikinase n=1 Tax=Magnetococcus marinus (strain ATCC BAA-1437 / JCM 17883 / MC-1) TaxID=156889 RepID=A0L9Q2_MAGMM|nr:pyruvate, phosphate dikinase [Magnetococcus marinus]ABK44695.1 pyruvate phosphate dikinase [Magnetococcus marinus MC-1]
MSTEKFVYVFGNGQAEGDAGMSHLLGGKGANLAEMTRLGIPVPAGFTLCTEVCGLYLQKRRYPELLKEQVNEALLKVQSAMGAGFGSGDDPLLVSVRSGARVSMPGMMDTVLNLGLNDHTVQGLIKRTGDARFAYDSYRRFVQMYADVVLGVDHHHFEAMLNALKQQTGKVQDTDITADEWKSLVAQYKNKVLEVTQKPFPEEPQDQLWGAIGAVFDSWTIPRAITYRRLNEIPESWGTAVTVQAMVFGNMGTDCATGVAFTRDPSTGHNRFFGEYLINAQGEDVVAGIRTPQQITLEGKRLNGSTLPAMEEAMPELYKELYAVQNRLEMHYREMQDIEFTIQRNKLWLLQTRTGKRTAKAALKIAVNMVHEGLINTREAVSRVSPESLNQLLHPTLDPKADKRIIAKGLAASPGAATGRVVFEADEAEQWAATGQMVILVRDDTSPEDIHGMHSAKGIITARGGMTSHAAVVARGMGRPCVSGCAGLSINMENEQFSVGGVTVAKGDWVTIDGSTGEVMLGQVPTVPPELSGDFTAFMEWVDGFTRMKVRANADTPDDARMARSFGAQGIGLCRTEHMFFGAERIIHVRGLILAQTESDRMRAIDKILPLQRSDFAGLFREMKGYPVMIRLLDPPLHEFIPHDEEGQNEVALVFGMPIDKVRERVASLKEFNPMLGHRGCRLGISFPEIYEMQVRAIMEAACQLVKEEGFIITPEIMIPLVGLESELSYLRERVVAVCETVMGENSVRIPYMIGTMIELPRAALIADQLAKSGEFFSFGTNDLTQTTMGISRDDAGPFLQEYVQKNLLPKDPFISIDQDGVGQLVRLAAEKGRSTRPEIKLGVCGEHGGDPESIHFFEKVKLDYVSCSPFRVPIARLAAAQAVLA